MEVLGRERNIAREHPSEQTLVAFEGQINPERQNKIEEETYGTAGRQRSVQSLAQEV